MAGALKRGLLLALVWLGLASVASALPVVPGAFGFGMDTRAAYGCPTVPAILRVTTLLDSGAGSLRTALTTAGPRVIIFETSGTIVLSSDINIFEPCLTVAGQTAPSPGITIRGGGLDVYAYNVLIQHIRIRPGDGGPVLPQTQDHDASIVYDCAGCPTHYTPHDVVFDHVSLSWSGGKLANADARSPVSNITYWRSIFSEALYYAANVIVSPGQPSSLALPIVDHTAQVSIIQNLFAHNSDRNPEAHGGTSFHFLNNIVYDWGRDATAYPWASFFYGVEADPWLADIAGNTYIAGGSPHPFTPLYAVGTWAGDTGSKVYLNDNALDQTLAGVSLYFNNMGVDPRVGSPPVSLAGITVLASATAKTAVLTQAGARPADRDAVDTRIVNDVQNYTGVVISSQNAVGGWPTLAVNVRGLTPPANPHTVTPSGYTNLEVWLQGFSCVVEGCSAPKTYVLTPGADLQFYINLAALGDTIVLPAGATFTGNYTLPAKPGMSYLTITSSGTCPAGVRVSPASVSQMATIQASPGGAAAIATEAAAHHYALICLHLPANPGGFGNIVDLGTGEASQNTLASVPHDLLVDRCYIHGDPTVGQKRGVALNSATTTLSNSYISDIKNDGQDSQAAGGYNGPGPFTITNNYLEAAGENIMFGGADSWITDLIPSNITVTGNYLTKQVAWRTQGWDVKNLFELKNADGAVITGNTFEYNWSGDQPGYAIVFSPRNQDGTNPWVQVKNVEFAHNVVRHSGSGINILGTDNDNPSQLTTNLNIHHNLFYDISGGTWGGAGHFLQIGDGADRITLNHNTSINDGYTSIGPYGAVMTNFVMTNNVFPDNCYGILGDNSSPGNITIAQYFPSSTILANIMIGAPNPCGGGSFPSGNYYPADVAATGFVDYAGGNYLLAPTSTFHNAGTDGTDPGYGGGGGPSGSSASVILKGRSSIAGGATLRPGTP